MDTILELLKQDLVAIVLGIILLMSAIVTIADIVGKFSVIIGKPVKWIQSKENDHKLLIKTVAEMKQYSENRIQDRQQSLHIQQELTQSISDIAEKIDQMQRLTNERFQRSEQKNNKRIRAELKDKISQSYRYYHALGSINDMELEALEDLIEEYEETDGENSFVHSVVQKEMYTWNKCDTKLGKN